jgi:hypothetical protein
VKEQIMEESFRAFADGLIDYAGMFPPARLSLPEAIENYLGYARGRDAWMLGRFVCSTEHLTNLLEFVAARPEESRILGEPAVIRLCSPGRSAPDASSFLDRFQEDLAAISAAHRNERPTVRVEILESRIPEDLLRGGTAARAGTGAAWSDFLDAIAEQLRRFEMSKLRLYLEGAFVPEWRPALARAIEAIAGHPLSDAGFKLRCGGIAASAFPTIEQIAFVLTTCRRAGLSLKATAGLHHPMRALRAEVDTMMHGFLNVFGAAFLGHEHDLGEEATGRILEEEDSGAFRFTPGGFAWRDLRISTDTIRALRRDAVTSFGSCSFDEPRADLRALGILDPEANA